jgi:acetyl-CoA carboxylase biotin carboxyl carrier protein
MFGQFRDQEMDIRKVKKLIELLDESGIAEIEITEGEESVRISRYGPGYAPQMPQVQYGQPQATAAPVTEQHASASSPSTVEAEPEEDGFAVIAPMVGTFYSAASPGSAPFVQVGDRVNQGDTLCIVEAMKMMNQIEAEVSGTIKSIRVQNGDPVEYGQVLFIIDQRGA